MVDQYTLPSPVETPLPDLLALIANHNPQWPCAQIIQESLGAPVGRVRFSWAEVVQHARNLAAGLRQTAADNCIKSRTETAIRLSRDPGSPPVVVGVLGNNGYHLYVTVLACLFNRWTILLISPKNSHAGIEHLLRISQCLFLLVEPAWSVEVGSKMEVSIPGLIYRTIAPNVYINVSATSSPITLTTTLTNDVKEKELKMPAFYLHTSGSTGHPKIVAWSHEFVLSGIRTQFTNKSNYNYIGLPLYCVAPIIHAMGIIMLFGRTLSHGNLMTFIANQAPKPPSAASLLAHLPFIKKGIVIVPPSILEELHEMGPDAVKQVADGTSFVIFGGAPLGVTPGNALAAAGVHLVAGYGSTEIHSATMHVPDKRPEDWQYVRFREGYSYHFLPIDDSSNLRELIVGPGKDGFPAAINCDKPYGYATDDIFEPHPTVQDLWKHHSRKGDITVLSNGEKSNNKQIEELLLRDKLIRFVLVVGAGRPMNCVVLQPADTSISSSDFFTQIVPTISHANSVLPNHSRLLPELVIVTPPDRLFATTDKGTVKKQETLSLFEHDIQNAYASLQEGSSISESFEGSLNQKGDVVVFLRNALQGVLGKRILDDADFFEHGLDSLLAMRLHAGISSVVQSASAGPSCSVPLNIIYSFPTINALTACIISLFAPGRDMTVHLNSNEQRIQRCIAKYSETFTPHEGSSLVSLGKVVALSGSTGSVGSSILSMLLEREDVKKVYLLNRKTAETQETRHKRVFRDRGIDANLLEAKEHLIVYLDVDFSRIDLGLSETEYCQLRDTVTHIIHAAWTLDFNLILESFERVHVAGVCHLINLALASLQAEPPHFTFLSSIAAVARYKGPIEDPTNGERSGQMLVPEDPIDDVNISLEHGYGQSKYVSERLLVKASNVGLRVTIIRIGQLSGTTVNGAWTASEHVPIMLRSSLSLGIVPHDIRPVRWVPSNIAASAILKLVFQAEANIALRYFSIENPYSTDWDVIVQALSAASPTPLLSTTIAAWTEHIRQLNPDPEKVPAIKLLRFYESQAGGKTPMAALAWEKSVTLVPELAIGPLSPDLIRMYVKYQQEMLG